MKIYLFLAEKTQSYPPPSLFLLIRPLLDTLAVLDSTLVYLPCSSDFTSAGHSTLHINDIDYYTFLVLLPPASEGWGKVLFSVCQSTPRRKGGGLPNPALDGGESPIQPWMGGTPTLDGGYHISGGQRGYPNLGQGVFISGGYPITGGIPQPWMGGPHLWVPSPPVKGKIFDTRFGLIHVQTGKKIFTEGPPPSKGENF